MKEFLFQQIFLDLKPHAPSEIMILRFMQAEGFGTIQNAQKYFYLWLAKR